MRCLLLTLIFVLRYFAIALVNKLEKRVRVPKHSVTIVYQIHLAGSDKPLAYTPLDEAWSDNIFYFATLVFKRSGHYTISFIAQGQNVSAVKPLVFNIIVSARIVKCGEAASTSSISISISIFPHFPSLGFNV